MALGLLVIRLVIGLSLAAHGAQKLFGAFRGGGLKGTGAWLESLGFRPGHLHATAAGGSEFLGGILLAAGFLNPIAAATVIGVMTVAGRIGHGGKGFFSARGGWEYCFVLAGVAAGLAFTGPGAWSLDAALGLDLAGPAWGIAAVAVGLAAAVAQMATRRRVPAPEHVG